MLPEFEKGTIVIAGGGTGGHLYPGLALAEEIKKQSQHIEIIFVGSKIGLEQKILPKYGFALKCFDMPRGSPLSLKEPFRIIKFSNAFLQCLKYFKQSKPKLVISLGGFAAFIPGIISRMFGIPLILLEQNVIPGRVTKTLARFAEVIFLQFEEAEKYIKQSASKKIFSGSPLSAEKNNLKDIPYNETRNKLLVVGGSQGAKRLNELVCDSYDNFKENKIPVIHISGERDYNWVNQKGKNFDNINVLSYCEEMVEVYKSTKLAVARSGASTINELLVAGIPSILVPYPAARDNHQVENAKVVASNGAGLMLEEKKLTSALLSKNIIELWKDGNRLNKMSEKGRDILKENAADFISRYILSEYFGK